MNDRNLGIFEVSEISVRKSSEDIAKIFSMLKIIPVRTELLFDRQSILYTALSDRFPEVTLGNKIPKYEFIVSKSKTGFIDTVEVKEVKE